MEPTSKPEKRARELLEEWLPADALIESCSGGRDGGADILVRTAASTLVIQVKRRADPGWLKHAVDQVREYAAKVGATAVPVVAVPFMGEFGKQLLREEGISWFERYDFSKHHLIQGHSTARSGVENVSRIAATFQENNLEYAATGLAGAWLLTEFGLFG